MSRRLHKRWYKATKKILEDQTTMCAATGALLTVASSFVLTTLAHIPLGARKDWLHILREKLEEIPTLYDMSADVYFDRPYSGFWHVSEKERRRAEQAGHPDQAHADERAFDVTLEETLASLPPYETDHIDSLKPERVQARRRSLDPDP